MSAVDMLAEHIASEELASRAYRYFQSWCGVNGWPGCEKFFTGESAEELKHMAAFQAYVDDRWPGTTPPPVEDQAPINFEIESIIQCFTHALELEKDVLDQINKIAQQAMAEADFDTLRFLQPYTEIGVNSIRELTAFTQQLTRAIDDVAALHLFDSEIGE